MGTQTESLSSESEQFPSPRTVAFHTLGCRLNFFETDGIFTQLKKYGFQQFEPQVHKIPELIVVNTCTVTNRADTKNRNIIRQAIRQYPLSQVWVTGCYAETDRKALESIPGIAGIVGNTDKSNLALRIVHFQTGDANATLGITEADVPSVGDRFAYSDVLPEGHTRAYLKIQDGCNRVCSYCKIPQARGKGVSRSVSDVLDQIRFLQDNGVGEIVLTGVNLGWFKNEVGEKGFLPLLESILKLLDYSRLRISSIEPPDVSSDLADLMTHPRFCKFLHVPLQSGSREILRKMKRSYMPETFRLRIEKVKEKHPNLFLGTDLILGFPGEGEAELQESYELLKSLGFAKIHAFPYSVRTGTSAEAMGDPIPGDEKKRRVLWFQSLSSELHQTYSQTQIGKTIESILENDGQFVTENYLKVHLKDPSKLKFLQNGQFVDMKLDKYIPRDPSNPKSKEGYFLGEIQMA